MLWDYQPGETLPEKWERLAGAENIVAIAIASADDEGRPRNDSKLFPRARQNVWLEIGWFWGKYRGRHNILILPQTFKGQELERPSDLSGLEVFDWADSPLERKDDIRRFLDSFA